MSKNLHYVFPDLSITDTGISVNNQYVTGFNWLILSKDITTIFVDTDNKATDKIHLVINNLAVEYSRDHEHMCITAYQQVKDMLRGIYHDS